MNRWRRLAEDMKETGMSFNRQAMELDKEWSTFQRWIDAHSPSDPRWEDGQAMIELHRMVCGLELSVIRLEEYKVVN